MSHNATRLTRITTQQYKYSLLPPLTGGAESMIRIASDTIVLQSSACTLCLCVGRAWRSPSVYSLKPYQALCWRATWASILV